MDSSVGVFVELEVILWRTEGSVLVNGGERDGSTIGGGSAKRYGSGSNKSNSGSDGSAGSTATR